MLFSIAYHLVNDMLLKMMDAALCLERLRAIPFVRGARITGKSSEIQGGVQGGVLRLKTPDGEHHLAIELRRSHLDRVTAEHFVHQWRKGDRAHIVVAPFVGEPLGDLFAQHGINFIDLQGNCSLNLDGRYIARIQRRHAPPRAAEDKPIRGPGYQVLLALLIEPKLLHTSLQEIAAAAGTSRQAPFDMRHRLEQEGFVTQGARGFTWVDPRRGELLDRFLAGYRDTLRPRLVLGRWRTQAREPPVVEERLVEVLGPPGSWRFGGAAGGYRLDNYYRGEDTTIYAESLPEGFARSLRALPSPDGNLRALRIPGPIVCTGPRNDSVHPLLVCAELLLQEDDRARAAAQRLRERFLG